MRQSLLRFVHPLLKRRNRRRKLELMEMQQLGEKRFVAIVRVGKQKFLIGGAASSISLLAEIGSIKTTILTPRPLHQELA
jgi:flagellar biogenesis protein FliO